MNKELADILRAEAEGRDLVRCDMGVDVMALSEDGTYYKIGWISETVWLQRFSRPGFVQMLIDRVKFPGRWKKDMDPNSETRFKG